MSGTAFIGTSQHDDVTTGLNAAQRQAVLHRGKPLAVLAGPGTGKTRVIVHRIAHLLLNRGAPPESILAVTFTVKAASQMRERLAEQLNKLGAPSELAQAVNVHTFHGLGMRIIQRHRDLVGDGLPAEFELTDRHQQLRMLRQLISQEQLSPGSLAAGVDALANDALQTFGYFYEHAMLPEAVSAAAAKWLLQTSQRTNYEDAQAHAAAQVKADRFNQIATLFAVYHTQCVAKGELSFGDLTLLPVALLRASARAATVLRDQYRRLVVDEFQDVSPAQIELLSLLSPVQLGSAGAGTSAGLGSDLMVVGDDDQAIYGFRGADDRAFQRFAKLWPEHDTIELSENYRSTPNIISACNSIITRAASRFAPNKRTVPGTRTDTPSARPLAGVDPAGPPVRVISVERDGHDPELLALAILTERATRPGCRYDDFAIIARTNGELERCAERLRLEGVPIRLVRTESWKAEPGVQLALSWAELICDGLQSFEAVKQLMQSPYSVPLETSVQWNHLYNAQFDRYKASPSTEPHPGSFVAWLRAYFTRTATDPALDENAAAHRISAMRFIDLHLKLCDMAAQHPANKVIFELVRHVEAAHCLELTPRQRRQRVSALLALQRVANAKQDRLEKPGQLPQFLLYLADLADNEDSYNPDELVDPSDDQSPDNRRGATEDRPIAGEVADADEAVTLITAHKSKGLEFPIVFVPRANPSHGYPNTNKPGELADVPPHLLVDPDGVPINATSRRDAEERRIFYVACTRAESQLIVSGRVPKSASASTNYMIELMAAGGIAQATAPKRSKKKPASTTPQASRDGSAGESAMASFPSPPFSLALTDIESVRHHAEASSVQLHSALFGAADEAPGARERPATPGELLAAATAQARRQAAREFDALTLSPSAEPPSTEAFVAPAQLVSGFAYISKFGKLPTWVRELSDTQQLALQRFEQRHIALSTDDRSAEAQVAGSIFRPRKGKLTLSYSLLNAFERCPRCWYISNTYQVGSPSSTQQLLGIAAHGALETFYKRWVDADAVGTAKPGLADLLALGRREYLAKLKKDDRADAHEIRQLEAQLAGVIAGLHNEADHVLELERSINIPLKIGTDHHTITARIDRIDRHPDGRFRVIDYKTGNPKKALTEPTGKDLQFGIYALALDHVYGDGNEVSGTAEYWLLASSQRGVLNLEDIDRAELLEKIIKTVGLIQNGPYVRGTGCSGLCDLIADPNADPLVTPEPAPE